MCCDIADSDGREPDAAVALLQMQERVGAAGGDLQGIMDAVTSSALAVFPEAAGAVIELRDEDELVYRSASGTSGERVGMRLKMASSLSGRCIAEGRPLRCDDAATDNRVDRAACLAVGVRSMLVVPLHDRGEVVGILKVYSSRARAFSARDMLTIQLLAGPLAIGFAAATEAEAAKVSRQPERRFLATFHQAAVGVAHVGADGRFLLVNNRFCEISGRSTAALTGRTFQEITHPDDLDTDLEYLRALVAGEIAHYSMEKRYLKADRSPTWINLTVSMVRGESGEQDFFVAVIEDINARKRAEQDAKHDLLTGLLNRRGLLERLEREVGRSCFHEKPLMVTLIDIDGFKGVNDSLGHAAGDRCLQAVAGELLRACRPADVLGRFGGDEFVVLTPEVREADAPAMVARLQSAVARAADAGSWPVGASIGAVCIAAADRMDSEEIIAAADRLMYQAKRGGGRQSRIGGIGLMSAPEAA